MNTVTVSTKCGDVIGRDEEKGYIFEGVPYATAERFSLPVAVTDFGGSFDATKKPIEFPQDNAYIDDSDRFYTREFRAGETYEYAESPLTLNIITPKDAKDCPVLVYIHGGGFNNGKQSEHPAGTSFEYAKRGVILVSISYRLNVFGLYRCGNYYLYDQVCAVKWIRDNIADYGGNPQSITLIGQSAGAMSIFQLLYTDCLKGIIKGVVMMSGAGFFPKIAEGLTPEQAKPFWDEVMHEAGCANDEEAKKVDAEKLWRAWWKVQGKGFNPHLMMPGIDGVMIPADSTAIKKSGKMLDVPMIVGVTSQDMYFSLTMFNMARRFARWFKKNHQSDVFLYYFDHAIKGHEFKAYHSADLWYVFGNQQKCKQGFFPEDEQLKEVMAACVEQFVKTGDPGWGAYTRSNEQFRRFDCAGPELVKLKDCFWDLLKYSLFDRGPF